MRGRSYSHSPSPQRGYGRRGRSPSPQDRRGGRGGDLPTSLLVRNLRHDCRMEDLRRTFEKFGRIKDVYLPRDYYTGEPRGFGFVQFIDPSDATEAKYQMDRQIFLGRELTVVFAEERRKRPVDMRARERLRGRGHEHQRSSWHSRSPRGRNSRSRSPRYNHSRSPRYNHSRSHSRSPQYNHPRSRTPQHAHSRSPHHLRSITGSPHHPHSSRSPHHGSSQSPSCSNHSPSSRQTTKRSLSSPNGKHIVERLCSPLRGQSGSRSHIQDDTRKRSSKAVSGSESE